MEIENETGGVESPYKTALHIVMNHRPKEIIFDDTSESGKYIILLYTRSIAQKLLHEKYGIDILKSDIVRDVYSFDSLLRLLIGHKDNKFPDNDEIVELLEGCKDKAWEIWNQRNTSK